MSAMASCSPKLPQLVDADKIISFNRSLKLRIWSWESNIDLMKKRKKRRKKEIDLLEREEKWASRRVEASWQCPLQWGASFDKHQHRRWHAFWQAKRPRSPRSSATHLSAARPTCSLMGSAAKQRYYSYKCCHTRRSAIGIWGCRTTSCPNPCAKCYQCRLSRPVECFWTTSFFQLISS